MSKTEQTDFNLDDLVCRECGGELDTGYECNRCGFDMLPFIKQIGEGGHA